MAVDVKKIKELRERTNSGFLDCKQALEANNNDLEKAIKWLQEKGIIKAAKKSSRIAAEGIVRASVCKNVAILFELNSETDFVAKNKLFIEFANELEEALFKNDFKNEKDLLKIKIGKMTVEEHTQTLTSKIGEKITLRRAIKLVAKKDEVVAAYTHADSRVATIALAKGNNADLLRNITMHITALNPAYILEKDVPKKVMDKLHAEVDKSPALANKPEKIRPMIKEGLIKKEFEQLGILGYQKFVMDDSKNVNKVLEEAKMEILSAERYEVGEGIEKKTVDFATEVAEQMK